MKEDEISSNQYKDFRRISCLLGYRSGCKILKLAHLSLFSMFNEQQKKDEQEQRIVLVKALYLIIEIVIFSGTHLVPQPEEEIKTAVCGLKEAGVWLHHDLLP